LRSLEVKVLRLSLEEPVSRELWLPPLLLLELPEEERVGLLELPELLLGPLELLELRLLLELPLLPELLLLLPELLLPLLELRLLELRLLELLLLELRLLLERDEEEE
jgi:hypothetical protein